MSPLQKEVFEWIKTIVVYVSIALFINYFIIVNAEVPTGSMENNIMTDDRVVAFRFSYIIKNPERFDIIVFKYPDNKEELFVKRVIGLPGETVTIKDGDVYINNSETPLDDSFIKEDTFGDYGPFEVPLGEYFVLGDNRNHSTDSRFWNYKTVIKKDILGRVVFRYFPKPRLYKKYKEIN